LRITAVRFPAYLRDKSPPEFEYCTVARRWLRVAFLLPGAAALALLPARKLNSTTASDLWIARQRRV
jgi:hypothetical protein